MKDDKKDFEEYQLSVDEVNDKILNHVFTHHSPSEEQVQSYMVIRRKARDFAEMILKECPACADRTAALRKVREAVMTANASIALGGESF